MYDYLDRQALDLPEPQRFVLAAMRLWVESARAGRCACATLAAGFIARSGANAASDFGAAMATLDREGVACLRFGPRGAGVVTDDEARLLTLLDAGLAGAGERIRRIAATLVVPDAVERLSTAIELLALHLNGGVYVERDR